MPCKQITVQGPKLRSVNNNNYTVNAGVNKVTAKQTVSNPNSTAVRYTSKVTVNGSQPSGSNTQKTITVPANGTATVTYSLSFNVQPSKSASHRICIKSVSTKL